MGKLKVVQLSTHKTGEAFVQTLLDDFMLHNKIYFAYNYRLNRSIQENLVRKQEGNTPFRREFWCNQQLFQNFADLLTSTHIPNIADFSDSHVCFKAITGNISYTFFNCKDSIIENLTITRKNTVRNGTLYYTSGLCMQGYCNNFYENEFICLASKSCSLTETQQTGENYNVMSFIILRGSIPLKYQYTPGIRMCNEYDIDTHRSYIAMKKHYNKLLEAYPTVRLINVIEQNNKASLSLKYLTEDYIGTLMREEVLSIYNFDYKLECSDEIGGMNNLSRLLMNNYYCLDDKKVDSYSHLILDKPANSQVWNLQYIRPQRLFFRICCENSIDLSNNVIQIFNKFVYGKFLNKCQLVSYVEDFTLNQRVVVYEKPLPETIENKFNELQYESQDSLAQSYCLDLSIPSSNKKYYRSYKTWYRMKMNGDYHDAINRMFFWGYRDAAKVEYLYRKRFYREVLIKVNFVLVPIFGVTYVGTVYWLHWVSPYNYLDFLLDWLLLLLKAAISTNYKSLFLLTYQYLHSNDLGQLSFQNLKSHILENVPEVKIDIDPYQSKLKYFRNLVNTANQDSKYAIVYFISNIIGTLLFLVISYILVRKVLYFKRINFD